jgi:predicted histone-like DNA-binding protein
MPVLYKPFQSTLEDKKSKKKLFYPRVVRSGNVDSAQLSKEIAAYSSLSPGDVKNTLDNLVTVMGQHLQSSESVSVDGLGTFRMVMVARGKGVETSDEVSAAQATLTVRFQPTTTKNLDRTTATRSMVTGAKCVRFDLADTSASGGGDSGKPDGGGSGSGGSGDGGGEAPDPAA